MLSRCKVEIHTLPVNQEYSLNILPFEGLLRPSFISQRQTEEPPNIWDTSGISGNVFLHIHKLPLQLRILKDQIQFGRKLLKNTIHMSTVEEK